MTPVRVPATDQKYECAKSLLQKFIRGSTMRNFDVFFCDGTCEGSCN